MVLCVVLVKTSSVISVFFHPVTAVVLSIILTVSLVISGSKEDLVVEINLATGVVVIPTVESDFFGDILSVEAPVSKLLVMISVGMILSVAEAVECTFFVWISRLVISLGVVMVSFDLVALSSVPKGSSVITSGKKGVSVVVPGFVGVVESVRVPVPILIWSVVCDPTFIEWIGFVMTSGVINISVVATSLIFGPTVSMLMSAIGLVTALGVTIESVVVSDIDTVAVNSSVLVPTFPGVWVVVTVDCLVSWLIAIALETAISLSLVVVSSMAVVNGISVLDVKVFLVDMAGCSDVCLMPTNDGSVEVIIASIFVFKSSSFVINICCVIFETSEVSTAFFVDCSVDLSVSSVVFIVVTELCIFVVAKTIDVVALLVAYCSVAIGVFLNGLDVWVISFKVCSPVVFDLSDVASDPSVGFWMVEFKIMFVDIISRVEDVDGIVCPLWVFDGCLNWSELVSFSLCFEIFVVGILGSRVVFDEASPVVILISGVVDFDTAAFMAACAVFSGSTL